MQTKRQMKRVDERNSKCGQVVIHLLIIKIDDENINETQPVYYEKSNN